MSDQISYERSKASASGLWSCYIEGMPHLPHAPVVYLVPLGTLIRVPCTSLTTDKTLKYLLELYMCCRDQHAHADVGEVISADCSCLQTGADII